MTRTVGEPDMNPATIMRLGSAFAGAKVLLSAIELDLFTELAKRPLTRAEIQDVLKLHPRVTGEWLSMLVALNLLRRDGEVYRNSELCDRFLDRSKPSFAGGFLQRTNQVLFPAWVYLTDALRTGEQQARHIEANDMFDTPYQDPEQVEAFLTMMDSLTSTIGAQLGEAFDWSTVKTVTDVGGARGNLLSLLLKQHEHLTGTVFDLAPLKDPADKLAKERGLADRLSFSPGSFFDNDLPQADVLMIGHVLHDWAPEERQVIVDKAFKAVNPGGAVLVYDCMLADEEMDLAKLTISIHMKLMTPGGEEYPISEGVELLENAGFGPVEAHELGAIDTLLIGWKQA
ncbi:methyltransferase [Kibdelosporangium phytohabitans]|uniref:Methyltransferase n=1 Tax=Kibdelosporangium phytohabitans TaxID=860235 RepID=A0A0N9HUE1_9PSEU|nr:methyltransferase [Kibdelosporangium phytohabitans]ALG10897.1 hypothetical protein AOZ06_32020 [Kibdelosporangium phytohabitans]MBE1462088.1 2-polyprenyl-3-methyl-5-hydroxy-6-metoxy-1,4-benzoquinol methylase [Kibdelosporangium phytohabitans]